MAQKKQSKPVKEVAEEKEILIEEKVEKAEETEKVEKQEKAEKTEKVEKVEEKSVSTNRNTRIIPDSSEEMGVISQGTAVVGNIRTKGHLAVLGEVEGDIETKGNVIISGKVNGKIVCANLFVDGAEVTSTIRALGQVNIKPNSIVNGDVSCKDLGLFGTLSGNVKVSNQACFYSGAQMTGEIKTKDLGVEIGAKITGSIEMGK